MLRCILNGWEQEVDLDRGSSVSIATTGMARNSRGAEVRRMYQTAKNYDNNHIKFSGKTTLNEQIKKLDRTAYFSCCQ